MINGDEEVVTRRVKLLKIITGLHDWAWHLLNLPEREKREQIFNDGILNPLEIRPPEVEKENSQRRVKVQRRPGSCSSKLPNTRYPSDIFSMN